MQFQFSTSPPQAPPTPSPQAPADAAVDLLRQLVEVQRESAAHQRDSLTQMLAVQQEQLNQARAAAQDAQARWKNLISRWQQQHPEFATHCKVAYPLLERAYVGLLVGMADELADQGDDALDNDFSVQDFLDRYGMRIGQLSHILSVLGPLAEAAGQGEVKQQ